MATAKKKKPKPTWRIMLIRRKGEVLGTVEAAASAARVITAVAAAAEQMVQSLPARPRRNAIGS